MKTYANKRRTERYFAVGGLGVFAIATLLEKLDGLPSQSKAIFMFLWALPTLLEAQIGCMSSGSTIWSQDLPGVPRLLSQEKTWEQHLAYSYAPTNGQRWGNMTWTKAHCRQMPCLMWESTSNKNTNQVGRDNFGKQHMGDPPSAKWKNFTHTLWAMFFKGKWLL